MNDISNKDYDLSLKGEELLESYKKLGSDIFKKHLSVKKSFKLISNLDFRQKFYTFFLNEVNKIIDNNNN
jgi:hypothetical protein